MVMVTSYLNPTRRIFVAKAMKRASNSPNLPFLTVPFIVGVTILLLLCVNSVSAVCELSYRDSKNLYNYRLTSPLPGYPHGVLSEDGFYKVAVNETVVWFQLCDAMLFNHDPPSCVDCRDCGGQSRCGMGCSALASNKIGGNKRKQEECREKIILDLQIGTACVDSNSTLSIADGLYLNKLFISESSTCLNVSCPLPAGMRIKTNFGESRLKGYPICNAIGHPSSTSIYLIDTKEPHTGVIVKMSNNQLKLNCSLSVSVICDSNALQGPQTLEKDGTCDYATQLRHPAGCAEVVSSQGNGWGWFSILITIIFCAFGGYLLAGAAYRYFFLHIHGIDIIPNLEFWATVPHRVQSSFMSLVRRFRGPSQGYRNSYSPVNF